MGSPLPRVSFILFSFPSGLKNINVVSVAKFQLHATVMNAKHRKRRGNRKVKSDFFNACGIFKQFGSEEWGEYLIREAHLSQRFKYDENGYYHCCASIPFPENMQVD
ncbi:Activating signal cointegrator 1 complex subunit 1 [Gossypium australe]|uniref:Activating signal cointegrator 1 complex subunit 1 n=1 Tax=Gossypium australe TaxID=47621 RepID=A0A5B6UIQ5_9ROSI|nr:Activating signal cointegrator 1 complex subunit 1 [Gossypium australe]